MIIWLIILAIYLLIGILSVRRYSSSLKKMAITRADKFGNVLFHIAFILFYPIFYIVSWILIIRKEIGGK